MASVGLKFHAFFSRDFELRMKQTTNIIEFKYMSDFTDLPFKTYGFPAQPQ
jgi:hypothetical protein